MYSVHSTLTVKENRIYITVEFTRKRCTTAILFYCFHTAGVLHIFVLYNLLGPGTTFIENLKLKLRSVIRSAGEARRSCATTCAPSMQQWVTTFLCHSILVFQQFFFSFFQSCVFKNSSHVLKNVCFLIYLSLNLKKW